MKDQNQTGVVDAGTFISKDEIPDAVQHEVALFQPAADWNNAMLGAFKNALKKPDLDIGKVKELLELQRSVAQENAKLEFNAAMARVQARIVPVVKNKKNKQTDSWYADLNAICEMVTPIYSAEGFSCSFGTDLSPLEGYTRSILTLAHHAGFEKVYPLDLPVDNKGMKDDKPNKTVMHGIKSSHSYARNMLISMAFNIAQKNSDDDGNAGGGAMHDEDVDYIDEKQHGTLVDMLAEKNLSPRWLCGKLRVDDLEALPAGRFNIAVAEIQKMKAQAVPPRQ